MFVLDERGDEVAHSVLELLGVSAEGHGVGGVVDCTVLFCLFFFFLFVVGVELKVEEMEQRKWKWK